MKTLDRTDPRRFIADFLTAFTDDLLHGDDDAGAIVDRYHVPDVVQVADGHPIDRERLIAHARPMRRRRPHVRIEVHEALADGDLVAARYTLHVRDRARDLQIETHFFGRFAVDGRLRRAHMLTRTLPGAVTRRPRARRSADGSRHDASA